MWEAQQLPDGWHAGDWRDFLVRAAKKRATTVWHNNLASNDSTIADNYVDLLNTADNSTMQMAEYLRFAGIEDEGARILFAIRAGASELRVDADRRYQPDRSLRVCTLCGGEQVEDARHVLRDCAAYAPARANLIAKMPPQLRDLHDDRVLRAIMQGAELRNLCPHRLRRNTVTAVKTFWREVYARVRARYRGYPQVSRCKQARLFLVFEPVITGVITFHCTRTDDKHSRTV